MDRPADPLTTPRGSSGRRTRLRRVGLVGVVLVAFVIVGALAAWRLGSSPSVSWRLAGLSGTRLWEGDAQTTTVIPINVPTNCVMDGNPAWLAPPEIIYTPSAVTITMRPSASDYLTTCGTRPDGHGGYHGSGWYGNVHLSEPLGGRALFDGSTSPPAARPYGTP